MLHGINAFFVRLDNGTGGAQHYGSKALLRWYALGAPAALFDALSTFFLAPTPSWVVSLEGIFSGWHLGRTRGDFNAAAVLEAALAEKSLCASSCAWPHHTTGSGGRRSVRPGAVLFLPSLLGHTSALNHFLPPSCSSALTYFKRPNCPSVLDRSKRPRPLL
eukprot:CAMPEP_0194285488 /NCGR_PEP_ID=MMETSP0169-20130528/30293_1 /TAXON_ID=218684 /ORGANISM="Corethron pennatum, Strain L29A3" /LENGTH=161 /DNA_ID=CAMNT_0039031623 /DNA_START=221 /DNA_END=706 /DNA_ORIENTATION=+